MTDYLTPAMRVEADRIFNANTPIGTEQDPNHHLFHAAQAAQAANETWQEPTSYASSVAIQIAVAVRHLKTAERLLAQHWAD